MLSRNYTGILSPYSLLRTSKLAEAIGFLGLGTADVLLASSPPSPIVAVLEFCDYPKVISRYSLGSYVRLSCRGTKYSELLRMAGFPLYSYIKSPCAPRLSISATQTPWGFKLGCRVLPH